MDKAAERDAGFSVNPSRLDLFPWQIYPCPNMQGTQIHSKESVDEITLLSGMLFFS